MSALLDTHFLLWIVLDVPRLDEFPWLERYRPWGISPVSLLEIQFLAEVGRLEVHQPEFRDALARDRAGARAMTTCPSLVIVTLPTSPTAAPVENVTSTPGPGSGRT